MMWKNRIPPRFILPLWTVIDGLLRRVYRIRPLRSDESGIICIELRRYNGLGVKLGDGAEIKPGDKIIELHLNSTWFRNRRKPSLTTSGLHWEVLHGLAKGLSLLAKQMANGMFDDVTALHGSTLLHVGAKRLGFQVEELPNTLWKKLTQFYLAGLMQIHYLGKGERYKAMGKSLEVKEVWLSRAALLSRYRPRHR